MVRAANTQSIEPNTLFIFFDRIGEDFIVRANFRNRIYSYKTIENANTIISDLEDLYLNLQAIYYSSVDESEVLSQSKRLGVKIFSILDLWIDRCEAIRFIIPENFIRLPFEFLQHRELPLFLQKPVTYSFSPVTSNFNFSDNWSALIVSDRTADPERGAHFVRDILSNSIYYDIEDLTLEALNSISPKDLVLISAHGWIDFNNEDYIALNEESITATHLARLSPKLIYLDSCQLGVSHEFIQSLRRAGTNYYIAPILSNEAGNSSTKTIEHFFECLEEGLSPSLALFETRLQLYKHFKAIDDYRRLIWRAFPFRVYHLN
ncbi:CHAT domain-containing protein [Oscillatoriales cyanobacterium LEGE 11467]|uniref:CHAT domain-containing protein n=1 Tax=Zarconia navalis LEGE 11467 TaxID=1828826 RepID=A0A928VZX1_9CYAN|nr:CHAT domain-containing protein [Zarconia navalis]MBE9041912.1 CHAT domain-containing protein [Zarconia navalis LEGE 11467]